MKKEEAMPASVAVQVMCRVRPFQARELELNSGTPLQSVVAMSETELNFLDPREDFREKECFHFDWNIWSIPQHQQQASYPVSSQMDVFNRVGKSAVERLFGGYNSCLLAYGQTGSGKTHTVLGSEAEKGLIPLFCDELFRQLRSSLPSLGGDEREGGGPPVATSSTLAAFSSSASTAHVEATLLEIYNDRVKDLLWELGDSHLQQSEKWDRENLKVRSAPGQGPYVVGLTTVAVESAEECHSLISIGMQNRVVAATKMNDQSSRSHALFRLTLVQRQHSINERSASSLFADLAGSERVKKSGAQGLRMREAAAINQSLTTLRSVIDALVDHRPVVPFRESTLTLLLSECLGGNSVTTMIACVSPHADNAEETLNTLRYAHRAQGVHCRPRIGETEVARRIGRLKEELLETQRRLDEGGGSGSPHQLLVVRAANERRIDQLEESSRLQRTEVSNLMRDLSRERERSYFSTFARQFHFAVLKRLHAASERRCEALRTEVGAAEAGLRAVQKHAEEAMTASRAAQKTRDADRLASLAARSHLEHVARQCVQLESENNTLAARDEHLRCGHAQHLSKLKLDHVRTVFLVSEQRHELRLGLERVSEELDEQLRACAEHADEEALASERRRLLRLREAEMQIKHKRTLLDECNQERTAVAQAASQKHQQLTEAAFFFEHENRAVDDERILRLQNLEREVEHRYKSERDKLQDSCTSHAQKQEDALATRVADLRRQRAEAQKAFQSCLVEADRTGAKAVSSNASEHTMRLSQATTQWRKHFESLCVWEMDGAACIAAWDHHRRPLERPWLKLMGERRDDAGPCEYSGVERSSVPPDAAAILRAVRTPAGQSERRSNRVTAAQLLCSDAERRAIARSASERLLFQPPPPGEKCSPPQAPPKPLAPARRVPVAAAISDGVLRAAAVRRPTSAAKQSVPFAMGSMKTV
jgi:hypothetical protein